MDDEQLSRKPRVFGEGFQPSAVDETWLLNALWANFNFHMVTAANETVQLLWFALKPFLLAFNGLWDTLWRAIDGTTKLAVTVGEAFLKYWSAVLLPIWAKLWAALNGFYELMREPLGNALQGLDYLVKQPFKVLLAWCVTLVSAVQLLPGILRGARPFALAGAQAIELLVGAVELRTGQAFAFVVDRYNEAATWVNHLVGEEGFFRPLTLVWSLWTFASDVVTTIGNALVSEDVETRWQQLVAAWPIVGLGQYLGRFSSGTMAGQAKVNAALDRFRSSGL